MSKEYELDPESAELENRLRSLSPAPSQLDRDALLYEAGRQAAIAELSDTQHTTQKSTSQSWRVATVSFAATSAVLAFLLLSPNATNLPDSANPNEIAKVEDNIPQASAEVETQVVTAPNKTRQKYRIPLTSLPGRRDPQRWLRETDHIVATSGSNQTSETRTIQDWYREIRNENQRTEPEAVGGKL